MARKLSGDTQQSCPDSQADRPALGFPRHLPRALLALRAHPAVSTQHGPHAERVPTLFSRKPDLWKRTDLTQRVGYFPLTHFLLLAGPQILPPSTCPLQTDRSLSRTPTRGSPETAGDAAGSPAGSLGAPSMGSRWSCPPRPLVLAPQPGRPGCSTGQSHGPRCLLVLLLLTLGEPQGRATRGRKRSVPYGNGRMLLVTSAEK